MPAPALGSALALARRCMPQEAAPLPSRADDGGHRSRWEEKKALMDARGAARRHEVQSKVEDANFGSGSSFGRGASRDPRLNVKAAPAPAAEAPQPSFGGNGASLRISRDGASRSQMPPGGRSTAGFSIFSDGNGDEENAASRFGKARPKSPSATYDVMGNKNSARAPLQARTHETAGAASARRGPKQEYADMLAAQIADNRASGGAANRASGGTAVVDNDGAYGAGPSARGPTLDFATGGGGRPARQHHSAPPAQTYAQQLAAQIAEKKAGAVDARARRIAAERHDDDRVNREAGELREQVHQEIGTQRMREAKVAAREAAHARYMAAQGDDRPAERLRQIERAQNGGGAPPRRSNDSSPPRSGRRQQPSQQRRGGGIPGLDSPYDNAPPPQQQQQRRGGGGGGGGGIPGLDSHYDNAPPPQQQQRRGGGGGGGGIPGLESHYDNAPPPQQQQQQRRGGGGGGIPGLEGHYQQPQQQQQQQPAYPPRQPQQQYRQPAQQSPQQGRNTGIKASSNAYASNGGGSQNCGNVLTDRPTSRVLAPPGGHSSISFG